MPGSSAGLDDSQRSTARAAASAASRNEAEESGGNMDRCDGLCTWCASDLCRLYVF